MRFFLVLAALGWMLPSVGIADPQSASDTDLNVTYIERTPRYNYDATKNNPAPGDLVTFSGHIRLWGTSSLASVAYRWQMDDVTVAGGTLTNLVAGDERVVTWQWTWQSGAHQIKLTVDPDNQITEWSELNNEIEDYTNAVIIGFWVERSLYDYFAQYQKYLPAVGSSSWEDWAQRHVRFWNQFNAQAIYPTTPNGVQDHVRLDKVIVVNDGALPLGGGGYPTNYPDLRDKTVDMMWGFPATGVSGYPDHTTVSMTSNAFYYEGSLLHELGHARYLIDTYGFDTHNTAAHGGYDAVQIYEGDIYVGGSTYMPFLAFGEVLYYNKNGKMMSGGYDQGWSEYDAGALNRIAGRRAVCGNYNSPCNIGEFLNDLPARNHIRITDLNGKARRGADVKVFQCVGGPGWYGKTFDNTPDLQFTSDTAGYVHVGRNPFTSGSIQHTYGIANGIVILRIQHNGVITYRFQEVTDFNIQYWRGNTQDAYYPISVPGRNYAPADFDHDTDVDVDDLNHLRGCLSGAGNLPSAGCQDADLDMDNDVDQSDFGLFQRCLNGPRVVVDPGCAD